MNTIFNKTHVVPTTDPLINVMAKLDKLNQSMNEIKERLGLDHTNVGIQKTSLHIPWSAWEVRHLEYGDEIIAWDNAEQHIRLALLPNRDEWPDVTKVLSKAKETYAVLEELIRLFQNSQTKKANDLSAVFLMNNRPLNPLTVSTFVAMVGALSE